MTRPTLRSLRARLMLIILLPLVTLGAAIGLWQIEQSRQTAKEVFDRSLLTTALAIVGDVARSGGDALSLGTRDLLSNTSGGPVFYHVYAPDGVYVTGFTPPPVTPIRGLNAAPPEGVEFFDVTYNRRPVRALRLYDVATLDGISGTYTYTVWQELAVRDAFLAELIRGTVLILVVILGTLALVVWFGVVVGLRPLVDLEDAVSRRGLDDLSPIQRPVPAEVQGLVRRLNTLFGQVTQAMETQRTLISNAAHQLRNPIAGILAMAEAVRSAPDGDAARARADDLVRSARHASDLANRLLTLERVQSDTAPLERSPIALAEMVEGILDLHRDEAEGRGVALVADLPHPAPTLNADRMLLREALTNLVDNALVHGGPDLTRIEIAATPTEAGLRIEVRDDGRGIPPEQHATVLARFGQAEPGPGSGLGLSIAEAVVDRHGGSLTLAGATGGLSVTLDLPRAPRRRMA
ncbi:sensor histidine kinase [Roseicyclus amphidinii]|uniref:sensor histidine kinase n=1 Tax=Roseicyclus amphidinii TaxID=3034232 RepID=UPI0024E06A92|nr:sensor histidine kinase [Roseicyclus sp. Amp-Y-6]